MDILERIKKLLRLAQNAGSEHEAANAAKRAAQLMAQHEIHAASIDLDSPDEPRAVEEIAKCHPVTYTKKRVAWHIRIASAVAASYGAECYTNGGYGDDEKDQNGIRFFGRLSAVQAATYTTLFLIRKVDEITDKQAPSELFARRYRNAFRLGCASRIGARINEEAQAERAKLAKRRKQAERFEATASARAKREQFDVSDEDGGDEMPDLDNVPTPPASAGVLARVEKDREEVATEYKAYSKKWGRATGVGTVSSGSGYEAGKAAGDRVKLGNRARGGLPKGQGVLP